jgi:hypothetical protein
LDAYPLMAVTAHSPATSRTASSPAAAASPTGLASTNSTDTISVEAPLGSFPIPHDAQVLHYSTCGKQFLIELNSVTPCQASSSYISALPRAGYTVTGNSLLTSTRSPGSTAETEFTSHGYKGMITAASHLSALSSMGPSPPSCPAIRNHVKARIAALTD